MSTEISNLTAGIVDMRIAMNALRGEKTPQEHLLDAFVSEMASQEFDNSTNRAIELGKLRQECTEQTCSDASPCIVCQQAGIFLALNARNAEQRMERRNARRYNW